MHSENHRYFGQRPKIDNRLSIRTLSCAKLHDGGEVIDICCEFVQLD